MSIDHALAIAEEIDLIAQLERLLQASATDTTQKFNDIMNHLAPLLSQQQQQPGQGAPNTSPNTPPLTTRPATTTAFVQRLAQARAAQPDFFNGSHNQGHAWLCSTTLYCAMVEMKDDVATIKWALTYFRDGRVSDFAQTTVGYEERHGIPCFPTWASFCSV